MNKWKKVSIFCKNYAFWLNLLLKSLIWKKEIESGYVKDISYSDSNNSIQWQFNLICCALAINLKRKMRGRKRIFEEYITCFYSRISSFHSFIFSLSTYWSYLELFGMKDILNWGIVVSSFSRIFVNSVLITMFVKHWQSFSILCCEQFIETLNQLNKDKNKFST